MPKLKGIELALRRALIKRLGHKGQQQKFRDNEQLDMEGVEKILLLRQDRLGDLIITLPFLKALRHYFPEKQIDIVLGKNRSAAFLAQPYVDNIWEYGGSLQSSLSLLRKLGGENYDLSIDLLDNASTSSSLLMKASKAGVKLGFDKSNSYVYSHTAPLPSQADIHILDRLNSLLPLLGCPLPERKIEIEIPDDYSEKAKLVLGPTSSKQKRLAINISGSTDEKYLGVEKHIELLKLLKQEVPDSKDWDIIIFGTFKHIEDLEKIREGANNHTGLSVRYAPITKDFKLYMAMLATADMLLSPDTAAVHLAAAFGVPVAVYYTLPSDAPERMPWYPVGVTYKSLVHKGDIREIKLEEIVGRVGSLCTSFNQY